jgi:cytochrome b561
MEERYGIAPAVLHWLLVFILYELGWYMVTLPKGTAPVGYFPICTNRSAS